MTRRRRLRRRLLPKLSQNSFVSIPKCTNIDVSRLAGSDCLRSLGPGGSMGDNILPPCRRLPLAILAPRGRENAPVRWVAATCSIAVYFGALSDAPNRNSKDIFLVPFLFSCAKLILNSCSREPTHNKRQTSSFVVGEDDARLT